MMRLAGTIDDIHEEFAEHVREQIVARCEQAGRPAKWVLRAFEHDLAHEGDICETLNYWQQLLEEE